MDIDETYPFDSDLVSATTAEFQMQMEYIKKHYTPITMQQMIQHIEGEKLNIKNPILVTFDDGFSDNYATAFPILKSLNIPATFFLTTNFIDHNEVLWYEKLAFIIKCSHKQSLEIPSLGKTYSLNQQTPRQEVYTEIVEALKLLSNSERQNTLEDLFALNKSTLEKMDNFKHLSMPMTWDNIREMNDSGMDFGSHTLSHPILSTISPEQLKIELIESKKRIESELNQKVDSIAYPVGQRESTSKNVEQEVEKANYKIGFSYIDGVDNRSKFSLGRIHVDYNMPMSFFKSKLILPALFCD